MNFQKTPLLLLLSGSLFAGGCVSNGKYAASQQALQSVRNDSAQLANKVSTLETSVSQLKTQVGNLNTQVSDLAFKAGQYSTDAADKASQLNKSKEELAQQQVRLMQLQALMDQQKKAIEDIRKKMAEALVGFSSKELTVSIKNGKVYVSLQESLLFPSGSANVNPKGVQALGKLATVLNANPDITVNIDGHTDSIPIRSSQYPDNWALSTARAVSIVRVLIKNYQVNPVSLMASGQSQYNPVESNSTPEGRAQNRRTDIILSPNLSELYKLLGTE